MTEYKLTQFDQQDVDIRTPEQEVSVADELQKLVSDSDFIMSDYGYMWPIDQIRKVGNSLRGPTIEFVDGTMTYWYNIKGGYKLAAK